MKRKSLIAALSLLCAALFVACSPKRGEENYLKVIPNESMLVLKLETGALLEKSGVLDNMFVSVAINKQIADYPEPIKELLQAAVKNPESLGIDIDKPAYMAVVDVANEALLATVALSDVAAFEKAFAVLSEGAVPVTDKYGMKCIEFGEPEIAVVYDDERLVIATGKRNLDIAYYLTLPEEKMAAKSERYARFFDSEEDVNVVMNLSSFIGFAVEEDILDESLAPLFIAQYDGKMANASLDFQNGRVELVSDVEMSDEAIELANKIIKTSTHCHHKYIPGSSIFVLNLNLDLMPVIDVLAQTPLLEQLNSNYGVNEEALQQVFAAISGEWTAAMWADENNLDIPMFFVGVECSDRSLFDLLVTYSSVLLNTVKVEEDVYSLKTPSVDVDFTLLYKNGSIMFMPSSHYKEIAVSDGLKPYSANADDLKLFSSKKDLFVLSAAPLLRLLEAEIRNSGNTRNIDDEEAAAFFVGLFKSLHVQGSANSSVIQLNTSDSSVNSLKFLFDKLSLYFTLQGIE